MPFRKTVKVQFSHPHYFVVSQKVLIEKSRSYFVIILIMEWSFRGGGHGRRRQCIFISTRDLKKVTLWLSVSFEGEKEKETCSVRLSTLQLLWRLCEPLQKHSNTGIQSDVCGTICVSVAQTEEPVQSFLPASAKANS